MTQTLSAADRAIIQRDPSLPGLGRMLDAEALLAGLQHSLPEADIVSLAVEYLRYKPASSCLARLKLHMRDGDTILAFAKALPRGGRDWGWHKRLMDKRHDSGLRFSAHALEDDLLLVARAEHDRRISALPTLFRTRDTALREAAEAACRGHIRPGSPGALPLQLSKPLEVLAPMLSAPGQTMLPCIPMRYKPERRLVGQLLSDDRPAAILRACTPGDYAMTLAGARIAQRMGGATLLATDPRNHCVVSSWLDGSNLDPLHTGHWPDARMMREVGEHLRRIHDSPTDPQLGARGRQQELVSLRQAADAISILRPELADAARALQRRLNEITWPGDGQPGLIHGDMSLEQLIHTADGQLRTIDWDNAAIGDPMIDPGTLLARLSVQSMMVRADGSQDDAKPIDIHQAIDALSGAYGAGFGKAERQRLLWYVVCGLLRLAPEGFRHRTPDWEDRMERILNTADSLLDTFEEGARPASPAAATPQAPSSALLCEATDTHVMQPLIRLALGAPAEHMSLQPVQVIRHKAGKRALLQYTLRQPGQPALTLLGKLRFKGVDRHGFKIQQALFQQGFDDPAISVPEPIALLSAQHLWLQRKVPGVAATQLLTPASDCALSARIGRAIHALHTRRVPTKKRWTLDDEMEVLRTRLQQTAQSRPVWAERIEAIQAACDQLAAGIKPNPLTGIHRDCYPDQILVDDEHLYWLDLDLYCEGDPALDIGNFVAHMMEAALRFHGDIDAMQPQQQALIDAYLSAAPEIDPASIGDWTLLSLARHIYLSTQFADRQHTTLPLIRYCEQQLNIQP